MNRTERRRAEHLARKAAYKAMKQNPPQLAEPAQAAQPEPEPEPAAAVQPIQPPPIPTLPKPELSAARLTANRANAQLSTGAKTAAGKAICSLNAVKTALTGRTVILPTDDVADYELLGRELIAEHQPVSPAEQRIVQCLIDAEWRLMRIPTIESGLYAMGREALADTVSAGCLETEIFVKQERHLRNLHLQENRIRRNREKDLQALKELQTARREQEAATAAGLKKTVQAQPQTAPPPPAAQQPVQPAKSPLGFEFETSPATSKAAA